MTTIWKYQLRVTEQQAVRVPKGAKALTAQMQDGMLCLWAMVDSENEDVGVNMPVIIHGTGHAVDRDAREGRYLSTVQLHGGALVFHIFVGEGF